MSFCCLGAEQAGLCFVTAQTSQVHCLLMCFPLTLTINQNILSHARRNNEEQIKQVTGFLNKSFGQENE